MLFFYFKFQKAAAIEHGFKYLYQMNTTWPSVCTSLVNCNLVYLNYSFLINRYNRSTWKYCRSESSSVLLAKVMVNGYIPVDKIN